jgi:hypothetical protein
MRDARRLYDEEGDNGRAAAFHALGAMWQFIALFKLPNGRTLPLRHWPISCGKSSRNTASNSSRRIREA